MMKVAASRLPASALLHADSDATFDISCSTKSRCCRSEALLAAVRVASLCKCAVEVPMCVHMSSVQITTSQLEKNSLYDDRAKLLFAL